ncbi:MAG TPA: cell division protein FtsK, partial [Pseudonocardiaceae bacterium]|nr:cell division protein FtsK [Pseudonocardiaceae bacterium]
MNKRSERRDRIRAALEDFRTAVGRALGIAAHQQDMVAEAHARVMVELWLRAEGGDRSLAAPLANPRMADVVARVAEDRRAQFTEWGERGPRALTELVTSAAPGSAGEPWESWLGRIGTADGTGELPELWRIGTAVADEAPDRTPFPVAIPLLDSAHLHVSTTPDSRPAAEAMVETLLLRVLSYLRPGLVHVHVWDTGQLTGSMPGLYPLTRAGLLTVHDPAQPKEL